MLPYPPRVSVHLCEVGPRDGLQNEHRSFEPHVRADLARRLAGCGLARIEAASFVNPKLVPQMAGAEEVMGELAAGGDAVYAGLVLNERGLERALAAGAGAIHTSYGLTDSFGVRNQNATVAEGARIAEAVIARARAADLPTAVALSVSFGCPWEGDVDPGLVIDHVARMARAGAGAILLADTIGVGVPAQVRRLVPGALAAAGGTPIGLHLHNTRSTALANLDAGLEHGATHIDASVGGLGGCPFAPNASGNVATEDVVFMLEREGIATGVDLDGLIAVARHAAQLLGRELPGMVYRAGRYVPLGALAT